MRNEQSVGKSEVTVSDGVSLDVLAVVVEDEEEGALPLVVLDERAYPPLELVLVYDLALAEVIVLATIPSVLLHS